ncbi:dolichol-P-glucose synthetase [Bacteroidia bacterium]|nr:dolichol-P-glucose synthetase [Bacteroidia bacterium]GHT48807.1 dolichol-P-glucose synthetase [Bacteroidia bacterium]
MARHFSKIFKILVPLILGIVIIYFLYRKTDFNELWSYIKKTNWGILAFSLIFGLSGNVIRGLRWDLLIKPLGYHPKVSHLIYAVLGNYAVNFAIPRAGEIWRCGVIAKKEKIPFAKLIGTLLIDRLFDMIMVILFIIAAFTFNVKVFYKNRDQFNLPESLTSPYFYLGIVVVIVLCIAVLVFFKENRIIKKIWNFFQTMWQDMLLVWKMKEKTRFIFYSFGIWISYFLYFYVTFYAFGFTTHLGIAAGLFVFTLGSVSMGIPSNGGLGPWQAAVVFGLCAFMVNIEQAKAFATVVFAVQSIWMVLCGLFGIAMLSIKEGNNRPVKIVN